MKPLRGLLTLFIIAAAVFGFVIFIQSNPEPIQLEFWKWRTKTISLGWGIFIAFFSGLCIALLAAISALFIKSAELSRYRRELQSLQKLMATKT